MRISEHPILKKETDIREVIIFFEGKKITAKANEPIAVALINAGIKDFRYTRKNHDPRGIYCAIGRCTDCMMIVNGRPNVRTCITPVEDGMIIKRSKGV